MFSAEVVDLVLVSSLMCFMELGGKVIGVDIVKFAIIIKDIDKSAEAS